MLAGKHVVMALISPGAPSEVMVVGARIPRRSMLGEKLTPAGLAGTRRLCPHGRPSWCMAIHAEDDPRLGQPICPDCYDYPGHVGLTGTPPSCGAGSRLTSAEFARRRRVSFVRVQPGGGGTAVRHSAAESQPDRERLADDAVRAGTANRVPDTVHRWGVAGSSNRRHYGRRRWARRRSYGSDALEERCLWSQRTAHRND
jgi:hypothetical protein